MAPASAAFVFAEVLEASGWARGSVKAIGFATELPGQVGRGRLATMQEPLPPLVLASSLVCEQVPEQVPLDALPISRPLSRV